MITLNKPAAAPRAAVSAPHGASVTPAPHSACQCAWPGEPASAGCSTCAIAGCCSSHSANWRAAASWARDPRPMLGSARSHAAASFPATPRPSRIWVSLIFMCSSGSRVITLPISTSPLPLGNLVSAWAEMSTPRLRLPSPVRSNGANAKPAPQVLSRAVITPRARQMRTCPHRSGNSMVTEPGASSHTSRVAGVMRAAKSAVSSGSYKPWRMPKRASSPLASARLGPGTLSGSSTSWPVSSSASATLATAATPPGCKAANPGGGMEWWWAMRVLRSWASVWFMPAMVARRRKCPGAWSTKSSLRCTSFERSSFETYDVYYVKYMIGFDWIRIDPLDALPAMSWCWLVLARAGLNHQSQPQPSTQRLDHLCGRLHQFDQYALAGNRELVVAFRVQKGNVMACRALADAARGKAHAPGAEPLHGPGQVVDPQADVVQRRAVHGGFFADVQRLHQVDLDLMRIAAHGQDVFIDVFTLALETAPGGQAQHVDPQGFHALLVGAADGDLLYAQNLERSGDCHRILRF